MIRNLLDLAGVLTDALLERVTRPAVATPDDPGRSVVGSRAGAGGRP